MAEHIIKVTTVNYDTMLNKAVSMARSGLAVGFDLRELDAQKRLAFLATFHKSADEGTQRASRRSARMA